MKFDDFINAVDRTIPISVNEQVATMLALIPEDVGARFGLIAQSMPDDVRAAYFDYFITKRQPAQVRAGRKAMKKATGERRIQLNITLPESLVARIPYPRLTFVERALLAALEA